MLTLPGFIGSHLTRELISHGYKACRSLVQGALTAQVIGLAQSDASAAKIEELGATAVRGTVDDHELLKKTAADSDGGPSSLGRVVADLAVVHLAYKHSDLFTGKSTMAEIAAADRLTISALGAGLAGSTKPFVLASGTLITANQPHGRIATERDGAVIGGVTSARAAALEDAKQLDLRTIEVRFSPTTHGPGAQGFIASLTKSAKASGVAGYPTDGSSRWTAVNVRSRPLRALLTAQVVDAASLIRLALERAPAGSVMHAADETMTQLEIATAIGQRYNLPVQSVPTEQLGQHFGMMVRSHDSHVADRSRLTSSPSTVRSRPTSRVKRQAGSRLTQHSPRTFRLVSTIRTSTGPLLDRRCILQVDRIIQKDSIIAQLAS